jgi:hypothetical protein
MIPLFDSKHRVFVGLQCDFMHQVTGGKVSHHQTIELLPNEVRGFAAQHDDGATQMRLHQIEPSTADARGDGADNAADGIGDVIVEAASSGRAASGLRFAGTPSSTPIAVTHCLVLVHPNQIKMCLHLRPQVQPQCTITLSYGTTVENFT